MTTRLPMLAILLGLGGLLPFAGFAWCVVATAAPIGAHRAMAGLVAYGATILAFLGAVHWGFALADPAGRSLPARLVGGVLPALAGAAAVLIAWPGKQGNGAIGLLAFAFAAVFVAEARLRRDGLMPIGYFRLRAVLTAVVVVLLVAVLVMRLAGLHAAA